MASEIVKRADVARRSFVAGGAAIAGLMAGGGAFMRVAQAQGTDFKIQFDWLMSNGQLGDVVALKKGFFAEQGLTVEFNPGGPNAQTVPPVLSGQSIMGEFSGSGQALVAHGNGLPIRMLAAGYQRGPFSFFSLPKNPVRKPADLVGKRVGIQPTARFLLDLILKRHGIDPAKVDVINIGFDMSPILSGQVDVITGFRTNTKALSVIGADRVVMTEDDTGLYSYANVYFTSEDSLVRHAEPLRKAMTALAKGWGYAFANRAEAVDLLCSNYPNLDREIEKATADLVMQLSFNADTRRDGWGTFSAARIQEQIDLFEQAKRFEKRKPSVDGFSTRSILDATASVRPKLG